MNIELEKMITLDLLYMSTSDDLVRRYMNSDTEEMIDEKIEVLEALKEGKTIDEIPNYFKVLDLPEDTETSKVIWD